MATDLALPPDMTLLPLLPLRDVVVFPHMVIPLFVGRPKSIKALDVAMDSGKHILLVAQKSAAKDDPAADDLYPIGCVATVLQMLKLPDGTVKVLVEGAHRSSVVRVVDEGEYLSAAGGHAARRPRRGARGRGDAPRAARAVRPVRQAQQEDPAGDPDLDGRDRRRRPAGRRHCRAPAAQARAEAGDSRDGCGREAPRAPPGIARRRGRHPAGRKAHPRSRQAPDGEEPARVLPERAGQGDPEGTGRGRRERRSRRDGKEDQGGQDVEGGRSEGAGRVQEAEADVADVGRGDGRAQFHRHAPGAAVAEEEQDQQGSRGRREDPRRRPLRPREGQGTDRRVPRGAAARRPPEGADPVPRRAARRRQDVARPVGRQGDGPQVRPHEPGRRARRGRDPRPPAHVHRLDAGQDPAEHVEGRRAQSAVPAGRGRQDGHGLPRRSFVRAARSARPGAEQHVHRSLRRGRVRPVGRDVRGDGQHDEHSGAAARPDGSDPALRLHRGREDRDREAISAAEAGQAQRPQGSTSCTWPTARCATSCGTTRARRACAISSATSARSAARS